jgi:hypothetical protein
MVALPLGMGRHRALLRTGATIRPSAVRFSVSKGMQHYMPVSSRETGI